LRWITEADLCTALPVQRQRARYVCRKAQPQHIGGIDFGVTKKLVMLGFARTQLQFDRLALVVNQLQRVAVYVITIADPPLGRITLALLFDLFQGKNLCGLQQIGLLSPGEQAAAGGTAGGMQQQQDKRQGVLITERQCRLLQTRLSGNVAPARLSETEGVTAATRWRPGGKRSGTVAVPLRGGRSIVGAIAQHVGLEEVLASHVIV